MRKKSIRLEDIAKLCNVDKATISRALNNKKGVSDAKKNEILKIALEQGFKPNHFASALAGGPTNSILVLFQNLELLNNEYYGKVYLNLVKHLKQFGYSLMTGLTDDEQTLKILRHKQVDGVILLNSSKYEETLIECMKSDVKLVAVGSGFTQYILNKTNKTPIVTAENRNAAIDVFTLLAKQTSGTIHYIYAQNIMSFLERLEGCQIASQQLQRKLETHALKTADYNSRHYVQMAEQYMDSFSGFSTNDAFFCANDDIAIGLYRYFIKHYGNIPCPMVGFDNTYLSELIGGGISSVEQNIDKIARETVSILTNLLKNGESRTNEIVSIKPQIIERNSTKFFRESKATINN